ncbi:MAG TPA: GAF domain-containing protein [Solirubrobacteraceae bacterium]|nr:GAF domain-containing protein [Solirubrobacteraceae bacterium]
MADVAASSDSPAKTNVLERVALLQLRAAAILRTNGWRHEAARAEQFAAHTRLMLNEPSATRRMHALTAGLYECSHPGLLLEHALEGAISLIGGDLGNIQLRDPSDGSLRIAVQCGFGGEFLDHFAIVRDDTSACGRSARHRLQTVIVDVTDDPGFAPHRAIAARSRFRAVRSTPLVDPAGHLHGVISTHYRRPHRPSRRDLQILQWYAEHIAAALAEQRNGSTTLHAAIATLHAKTADLHDTACARLNASALALLAEGNAPHASAIQERARRARDRAQRERRRAEALLAQGTDTARATDPASG